MTTTRKSLSSTLQVCGHAVTVPVGVLPDNHLVGAGLCRLDNDRAASFRLPGQWSQVGSLDDPDRLPLVGVAANGTEVLLRKHDETQVVDVERGAPPLGGTLVMHPVDLDQLRPDLQCRDVLRRRESELGLLCHVRGALSCSRAG